MRKSIDDYLIIEDDKVKQYCKKLYDYAVRKGAKIENYRYPYRFRYVYKKEQVLVFETRTPYIAIPYNNQYSDKRNSWDCFKLFMIEVEKRPDKDELIEYIQKEICVCGACSKRKAGPKKDEDRCGHWLDIYGMKRFAAACHPEISKAHLPKEKREYTDYDIQMLKRLMDVRFAQIDNYQ